ncbi:hypothetical protein CDV31_014443 [Fusarium ambrosium]|uniref:Uncharacterized protein n=1 Tax=Fusarium ambrosium TaxID=131363 RepID=A0A428SWB9_9HYPO|nr:hypothetical protein CDV31_014443 [Fusarium ambrosium]
MVNAEVLAPLYSRDELVEDLQSSHLFCLQAESGQLRFILSELATATSLHVGDLEAQTEAVSCAIRAVGTRYSELLRTARLLNLPEVDSPSQTRFIINLGFIASLYHAVVLGFLRISNENAALTSKRRLALREIMSLASKAHRGQGDQGMIRFAWPLFVAALESDDMTYRSWILERYDALAARSENFRRARNALHIAFREQEINGLPIIYTELVRRGDIDRFVIERHRVVRSRTPRDQLEREVNLIAAAEEENKALFNNSWKECFVGSNLRRTLVATGVQCLKQAQGDSFMSSYAVVFFQALGLQDVYKIMILFLLTMALSRAFAFYIPDRFGRRPILIW